MTTITQIPSVYQLAVYYILGSKLLCDNWWNSPNVAFGLLTPLQQWDVNPDVVKDYIIHSRP